jgi:predicted deacylase
VPAANPIGLAQAIHGAAFGRFDLTTGVNFNRAYKHVANDLKQSLAGKLGQDAAANVALIREHARASIAAWTPATDAETLKKTLMTLAIDADIVLDLHCDNEAVLHIYAGTPLAEAIAPLSAIMGSHATCWPTRPAASRSTRPAAACGGIWINTSRTSSRFRRPACRPRWSCAASRKSATSWRARMRPACCSS